MLIPVSIVKSLTLTISHPISKTQLQKYFGSKIAPTFGLSVANGFSVKLCKASAHTGAAVQHAARERLSVTINFKLSNCLMTFVTS